MTTTRRQPTGIPTGGQFATTGRAEPLFTLDAAGEPETPLVLHAIGFNDEQTACDRCGRVELKGTVILADDDGNEVARMGTTCASKALGTTVTRDSARRRETVRRSYVVNDLMTCRSLADEGRFAFAAQHLGDARKHGLHRTDEVKLAARLLDEIDKGLAARPVRWAVVSIPGRTPAEVDTLEEAQSAAAIYARHGGYVVQLEHDRWVPAAA